VGILVLPVLLTLALVSASGHEAIEREIQRAVERDRYYQEIVTKALSTTARPMAWEGKDVDLLGGYWTLTEEGLRRWGDLVDYEGTVVVNEGYLIFVNGRLWIDESKEAPGDRISIQSFSGQLDEPLRSAEVPITMRALRTFYLFLLYPQAICLLISLFYGTSVLGHELSGKTLTYLFTRALPRWRFVLGKYLGILAALTIPAALSLLISWVLMGAEGGFVTLAGLLAGTLGALFAYNALFILFGFLIPRRAMIAALIYGVVFELILSFIPALVNQFTITYYLRSIVVAVLDVEIPKEAVRVVGGASPTGAILALAGMTIGALVLSSLLATHREYVIRDQA